MTEFWKDKRVLVTGGAGFIGRHVVSNLLEKRGLSARSIVVPRSRECDLREMRNCLEVTRGCNIVIHLAARTGGIAYSRAHPASQYYDCMLMNLHVLEAARLEGVQKFVGVGNILVYPESAASPLREAQVHDGKVAATHLGIGMAKRDFIVMAEMYDREYGMNAVNVLAANAYGPGDRFDLDVAHVVPAMIVKCHSSEKLVVWGDGRPTRDFLYVEDVAEGIILAAERLNTPQYHINIASGREVSIGELARTIAGLCGFEGEITFDVTKGGGDPRRCADAGMAREMLGFVPSVGLEEGLRRTIEWYREYGMTRN
jgi:GDP-L-fucose synthase